MDSTSLMLLSLAYILALEDTNVAPGAVFLCNVFQTT